VPDGIYPLAEFIKGVKSFNPGGLPKVGFCDHTAVGFYGTLREAAFWNNEGNFFDPRRGPLSVHFGIARDGRVCQMVNIFDRANGQGRLGPQVTWPPFTEMGHRNPNEYLISTEHEDAIRVPGGDPLFVTTWTPEMYEADLKLKRWCIEEVRRVHNVDLLRFGIDSLSGHHMFDNKDRAECPGVTWRNEYRARLFADLREDEVYRQLDAWSLENFKIEGGGRARINARQVFGVPAEARRIRLELMLEKGYCVVLHGDTGAQAGRAGWGFGRDERAGPFVDQASYFAVEVCLNAAGEFELFAEDRRRPVDFFIIHCTAWLS
jgi:hypothetical protein